MYVEKEEKILKNQSSNSSLNILFIIFIFFGIAYTVIDPLIPILSEKLKIGYDKIGLILFLSSTISLVSTFIAGRLSDKYNLKRIILSGLIILATGFLIFGIYISLFVLIISLIFLRLGCGILDSGIHTYITKMFDANCSPVFIKLDFFWYIGAVLGPLGISIFLFLNLEIKFIFIFFFVVIFFMTFLFLKLCHDISGCNLNLRDKKSQNSFQKNNNRLLSYKEVLRNKVIMLCCAGLFFNIGIFSILSIWLTTYFSSFNIPISFGSAFLTIFWVFNSIGVIISGQLVKKISELKLLFIFSIIGCISTILYSISQIVCLKLFFLIIQAMSYPSFFPILNAIAVEENKKSSGTILSVTISMSVVGLIFFQLISGYIMEYYKILGINVLLIVVSVCCFIIILILFRVKLKAIKAANLS